MDFGVLGPLLVRSGDTSLTPTSAKQLIMLGVLLSHAGSAVSPARLTDALWDAPPPSARDNLRLYAHHLRRSVGDRLIREANGYTLRVEPGELDVDTFTALTAEGEAALAAGDAERASRVLTGALDLWRGEAYENVAEVPLIRQAAVGLDEARLRALETRLAADLELGRHATLIPELTALTAEHPYRENLRGRLMQALYGSGRMTDALEVYRATRELLNEQLGLDPGPELRRLHERMLRGEEEEPTRREPPVRVSILDDVCPYQGLTAFEPDRRDWYFGRTALLERLRARVDELPVVGVFGASGGGKSSLLRAGLVGGADPRRRVLLLTPTREPLEALAAQAAKLSGQPPEELAENPARLDTIVREALTGEPPHTRALIVVDQFEELFTLCSDQATRVRFVDALLNAAVGPGRRATLVLGVRADFLAHVTAFPALAAALDEEAVLLVGPPAPADLREIVVRPAVRAGLAIDPDLVATVLADTAEEPGALPLLSHALLETWHNRSDGTLTLAGYHAGGGVRGAIAQTAEREYDLMSEPDRRAARQIFVRLTALGDGTEDTRRPIGRVELDGVAGPGVVDGVLDRLAAARLIVLGDDHVEVAHEALIRAWPRLHHWLTDDREALLIHRRLSDAARSWRELDRDPGALYRGAPLAASLALPRTDLNELESDFLRAGQAMEGRRVRGLRHLVAALAALLLVAVAAGAVAVSQTRQAQTSQATERAHQLALSARRLVASDPDVAGLLAVSAYRAHPDRDTEGALISAASTARPSAELDAGGPVLDVAVAGTLLASAGRDGSVTLWDSRGPGKTRLSPGDPGLRMTKTALSADGRLVAGAGIGLAAPAPGVVTVWDARTHEVVFQRRERKMGEAMAFSRDGETIAITVGQGLIQVWDVVKGTLRRTIKGDGGLIGMLSFSPDARLIAAVGPLSADPPRGPSVWDADTGDLVAAVPAEHAHSVAFDDEGGLVTGSLDEGVHRWQVGAGRAQEIDRLPAQGPLAWDTSTAVGGLVAVADENGLITIWDLARRQPVITYQDRGRAEARVVTLGPSGNVLVSAGISGKIVIRDRPVPPFTGHAGAVDDIELGPDGTLATAGQDGTVRLWDAQGEPLAVLSGHSDRVYAVAFSPDGRRLSALTRDHVLSVWDVPTRKVIARVPYSGFAVSTDLAWSPDGGTIVTAAIGRFRFRVNDRKLTQDPFPAAGTNATTVAYSADGRLMVTGTPTGEVVGWNVPGEREAYRIQTGQEEVRKVAVSPDGRTLATAGGDRTIRLWDAATGRALRSLEGHTAAVLSLAWSADSRTLASGGDDHSVLLWRDGRPPHTLSGHPGAVTGLVYTPSGLVSADETGRVIRWASSADQALDLICAQVKRPFAAVEAGNQTLGACR